MAHRNMVDGTAYDTTGGRVMVDGTVYGIDNGKTMVDGTVRDILFSSAVSVSITGEGDGTPSLGTSMMYMYVKIAGQYYLEAAELDVEPGDEILMYARHDTNTVCQNTILVDGTSVASSSGKQAAKYTYTVPTGIKKITIEMTKTMEFLRSIKLTTE